MNDRIDKTKKNRLCPVDDNLVAFAKDHQNNDKCKCTDLASKGLSSNPDDYCPKHKPPVYDKCRNDFKKYADRIANPRLQKITRTVSIPADELEELRSHKRLSQGKLKLLKTQVAELGELLIECRLEGKSGGWLEDSPLANKINKAITAAMEETT